MNVPTISVDNLADQIAGGALVVDVREIEEWEQGRIRGATLIPLGEVVARFDEFPSDNPVYVMCRSGIRSADACEYLRSRGIDAINVAGGILAWVDSDREIERGAR
tara:strand:+ start:728 stop:1045 length:318 start_codon:yes stop_codon:yes gene_type:complete